jgi:hypothetical protein
MIVALPASGNSPSRTVHMRSPSSSSSEIVAAVHCLYPSSRRWIDRPSTLITTVRAASGIGRLDHTASNTACSSVRMCPPTLVVVRFIVAGENA